MTPQQGWQCPVCQKVNAPWVPSCKHEYVKTLTSSGSSGGVRFSPSNMTVDYVIQPLLVGTTYVDYELTFDEWHDFCSRKTLFPGKNPNEVMQIILDRRKEPRIK